MSQRTGQFDAIVEVSLTTINCILATIHQNADSQGGPPHFLHRVVTRTGDSPSPGPPPPGVARGTVKVQLSVPTVALAGADTQDLVVKCEIRAYFDADPGSAPFAEFIHGTLQATYSITTTSWQGQTVLQATVTNDDSKIVFVPAPGSGLSVQEVDQVTQQLRLFLRTSLVPVSYVLPQDFEYLQFKSLSDPQGNQALAVPVNLSGMAPLPGALNSVTQVFTDSSAFALAISREYLEPLLQPALDPIRKYTLEFKIKFLGITVATYTVSVTSVTVTWKPGQIVLTIIGQATTGAWLFKNYYFTVTQAIKLNFNQTTQSITLEPAGDPVVTGNLPASAESSVKSEVIQARASALAGPQAQMQQTLATQKASLVGLLKSLDNAANLGFDTVVLDPDGVLLHGYVQLSARRDPYVEFSLTPDGKGYTALESWIPGGTIDKYTWTYYYKDYLVFPWSVLHGTPTFQHDDMDRFLLWLPPPPEPGLPFYPDGICLAIWGSTIDPNTGDITALEAGQFCSWSNPLPPIPSLQEPPLPHAIWVAKNLPDPPPEGSRFPDAGIRAHINVAMGGDPQQHEHINAVVQIVATEAEVASLGSLAEAVRRGAPPGVGISVVIVFRQGLLTRIGPPIIPPMRKLGEELGTIPLVVTEDYQGSWSLAFRVPEGATTFLINSEGKLAWEHRGPLDPGKLKEALPTHLTFLGGFSGHRLGPSVRVGDVAPDFFFEISSGERLALRKLRGKRVQVNFWQSWSAPCLVELRRLQSVYDRSARDRLVILAIQGDDDPMGGARVRDQLGLKFPVLPDRNGAIAQQYGVRCWPTTLSINQDGCVSRVGMGIGQTPRTGGKGS